MRLEVFYRAYPTLFHSLMASNSTTLVCALKVAEKILVYIKCDTVLIEVYANAVGDLTRFTNRDIEPQCFKVPTFGSVKEISSHEYPEDSDPEWGGTPLKLNLVRGCHRT